MLRGMLLQGVGLAVFTLRATTSVGSLQLILPLLVAGIGVSMAIPTTATAALSAVAPSDMGKASGTNSTLQRFGSVFGVAVVSAIFAAHGTWERQRASPQDSGPRWLLPQGSRVLGALSALAVGGRQRVRAFHQPEASLAPALDE